MALGRGLSPETRFRCSVSFLVGSGILLLTSVIGNAAAARPGMSARAKQGAALFQQHCVTCHNKQPGDTTPFGPPNLHGIFSSHPMVNPPITEQGAMQIIKNGKAPMPPFAGVLTNSQIRALIAYLKVQ